MCSFGEGLRTFVGLVTVTLAIDGTTTARRARAGSLVAVDGRDGAPRVANEEIAASVVVGGRRCTFRATRHIVDVGLAFDDPVLARDQGGPPRSSGWPVPDRARVPAGLTGGGGGPIVVTGPAERRPS